MLDVEAVLAKLAAAEIRWWAPFSESDVARVDAALASAGTRVPPLLRAIWQRFGVGELEGGEVHVDMLEAGSVIDLASQYAELALSGVLPFAGEGGARDYAVDLVDRHGEGEGAVLLIDRGAPSPSFTRLVAPDLGTFFVSACEGTLDLEGPSLEATWTEREREAAYARLEGTLAGLGRDALEVVTLRHRTWTPRTIRPLRDVEIAGIPCRAGASWQVVHLDLEGRPTSATLSRTITLGTRPCAAGTFVVLDQGEPTRFTPAEDVTIEGLRFAAHAEITLPTRTLDVLWGTLAAPTRIAGVPCAAAPVQLDASRRPTSATLTADHEIDGVRLPAGTWFERLGDRLYAFRLAAPATLFGRSLAAGSKHLAHELRTA